MPVLIDERPYVSLEELASLTIGGAWNARKILQVGAFNKEFRNGRAHYDLKLYVALTRRGKLLREPQWLLFRQEHNLKDVE